MNADRPRCIALAERDGGALPTALAFSRRGDDVRFGYQALETNPAEHDLLVNWKLLVGLTDTQILKRRSENTTLDRILSKFNIEQIVNLYVYHLIEQISEKYSVDRIPEIVVGYPNSQDLESKAARSRYKRIISGAMKSAGISKVHFFPEPFAIFQSAYHSSPIIQGKPDQIIFVLDIGGGTTNTCVIRTSSIGRLSRAGTHHIPHSPRTVDIGGSFIDEQIVTISVRSTRVRDHNSAVEQARRIKEQGMSTYYSLPDPKRREIIDRECGVISLDDQGNWPVTFAQIEQICRAKFWPFVSSVIKDCVDATLENKKSLDIEHCDAVILAGGTGNQHAIYELFVNEFGEHKFFKGATIVSLTNYISCVSDGLTYEALANCRKEQIRPAAIAPYIQEDISMLISSSKHNSVYMAKLTPAEATHSVAGRAGQLYDSPIELSALLGRKDQWSFRVKNPSDTIFYNFYRGPVDEFDDGNLLFESPRWAKLDRKAVQTNGRRHLLDVHVTEDGYAHPSIGIEQDEAILYSRLDPIDLHELGDMSGSVFVAIDLGTSYTALSVRSAETILSENIVPSEYHFSKASIVNAERLSKKAKYLVENPSVTEDILERYEASILADYVYHSNRIEGSLLSRGETHALIEYIPSDYAKRGPQYVRDVETVNYYDETSKEVRTISRPVRDKLAATNLRDAYQFVRELSRSLDRNLDGHTIREIHSLVMREIPEANPGRYRNDNVQISQTTFVPPEGFLVQDYMDNLNRYLQSEEFLALSPLVQAAAAHVKFVSVHPFTDGNGRVARLIANYYLWRRSLPGIFLPYENRFRYYDALDECNSFDVERRGDLSSFLGLFCDQFADSLEYIVRLSETPSSVPDKREHEPETVVFDTTQSEDVFGRLLGNLQKKKLGLSPEEMYSNWESYFRSAISEIKVCVDSMSRVLEANFGGGCDYKEYGIVDFLTYSAIRRRDFYSRTWLCSVEFRAGFKDAKSSREKVVFYFARSSDAIADIQNEFAHGASLRVSRYHVDEGRYVDVSRENWSRVMEIAHNGSIHGVVINDQAEGRIHISDLKVRDWFGIISEDVLYNLMGVTK